MKIPFAASKNNCGYPRNPCAVTAPDTPPPVPTNPDALNEPLVDLKYRIYRRLISEQRWTEAVTVKDGLIREAREAGLGKEDAQRRAYLTIEEMFPPMPVTTTTTTEAEADANATPWGNDFGAIGNRVGNNVGNKNGEQGDAASSLDGVTDGVAGGSHARARDRDSDSQVIGLGDLPEDWPTLPGNAPLAQEIQWVQANRLQVVTEAGERSIVDLSKALTPAPSYAALGWLETSIRAYTKFVDVAAKATASLEDEREHVRREKLAIEDIRKLLAEMVDG